MEVFQGDWGDWHFFLIENEIWFASAIVYFEESLQAIFSARYQSANKDDLTLSPTKFYILDVLSIKFNLVIRADWSFRNNFASDGSEDVLLAWLSLSHGVVATASVVRTVVACWVEETCVWIGKLKDKQD